MHDLTNTKTSGYRHWPGHDMQPPHPVHNPMYNPHPPANPHFPPNYGGDEDHNSEDVNTTITNIVTTIKNLISNTQPPNVEVVKDGDIPQDGDMGVFIENTAVDGSLDSNINSIFETGLNEGAGVAVTPSIEETVKNSVDRVTDVIETTTDYIKNVFNGVSETPMTEEHYDGMMSHHTYDKDHETIYIVLGVVLAVLVLIGIILGVVYWNYKRRGFHEIGGENKATLHKAKEPSVHTVEQGVSREDTWLKASKGGKK